MSIISSASNFRIRQLIRLKESRVRRQEKSFLIDGVREILRAWDSGFRFNEVYVPVKSTAIEKKSSHYSESNDSSFGFLSENIWQSPQRHQDDLRFLLSQLRQNRIPIFEVEESLFPKICFGDRNEGIIAVVESRTMSFDDWKKTLSSDPLIGVLENIEKPGNIGAVYRSADGAGLNGIILISDHSPDLFNPNIIRASLGTLFRIPTVIMTAEETISALSKLGIQIAAAICDAAVSYTTIDFCRPTAIVLGSESDGLTPLWSAKSQQSSILSKSSNSLSDAIDSEIVVPDIKAIKLPMLGIADSLNISNAAAILFYEARRQRQIAGI